MKNTLTKDRKLFSFSELARQNSWLYRGTIGLRFLLSMAFIPTGLVKLFGLPFANLGSTSPVGLFFDMLLATGVYWQFLGGIQILAGMLVLFNRTLALGSILFTGIMLNILFITIGVGFGNTAYLALLMVLGCLWLCFWEWGKLRVLFFDYVPVLSQLEEPRSNSVELTAVEKIVYSLGYGCGILFFGMTRDLSLPAGTEIILVGLGLVCLVLAFILGFKAKKR